MGRWVERANIAQHVDAYCESSHEDLELFCSNVAETLTLLTTSCRLDEYEKNQLEDIIHMFRHEVESVEDVDNYLDSLYDWGDSSRVWLGP